MNLSHVLTLHAKYRPRKIAVRDSEREFTYAELEEAIQNLANGLGAIGVNSGDVVGVGLADCIEHLVALYAVARMGAIVLPMDVRGKPGETARVLAEFEAGTALLENSGFRQLSESGLAVPVRTPKKSSALTRSTTSGWGTAPSPVCNRPLLMRTQRRPPPGPESSIW